MEDISKNEKEEKDEFSFEVERWEYNVVGFYYSCVYVRGAKHRWISVTVLSCKGTKAKVSIYLN